MRIVGAGRESPGAQDDVLSRFAARRAAESWARHVRSALLHAISLDATSWALARSRGGATSRHQRERLRAELDRGNAEIALLMEELRIKDAQWGRQPSRRRPHYTAIERLRILELKVARGWSREHAAQVFLLNEQTVRSWHRCASTNWPSRCKFPEFVRYLKELKALVPSMESCASRRCWRGPAPGHSTAARRIAGRRSLKSVDHFTSGRTAENRWRASRGSKKTRLLVTRATGFWCSRVRAKALLGHTGSSCCRST